MSADGGEKTACPVSNDNKNCGASADKSSKNVEKKNDRKVSFPDEQYLVTQYFEPADPWQDVPQTSREELAMQYIEACRQHSTPVIPSVLEQIRELPEAAIGGACRAPRLVLAHCSLAGGVAVDALEALLSRVQFRRIELDRAEMNDEAAEALFDMIEYYESANALCIVGAQHFAVRGWQAASRMIKRSAELTELEIHEDALDASHAPILSRSLRPACCRLRTLCLHATALSGESVLSLVMALMSNCSVRELRLGDNGLTASDAMQLATLLKHNPRLALLDLSNNMIQDTGAGHIANALAEQAACTPPSPATSPCCVARCPTGHECRGLAFLVLWNNQLTRNSATHLSKAVRTSRSLSVLNVGRNAVGAETVRALAAARGSVLASLGLQAARLGADAARALADLVRADTGLQRLDLRENRLGCGGLEAILAALKDNKTLIQIDLDEPTDDGGTERAAQLTREIRALCRRNEPSGTTAADSPERRAHRKISLTCRAPAAAAAGALRPRQEEERRGGRLRSPAPSPAGSPVPTPSTNTRFSVTRVTPDRDSSGSSTPPTPTQPQSRFKVVQVAETQKIKAQPTKSQKSSRFSVTRNYDSSYDLTPSNTPPEDSIITNELALGFNPAESDRKTIEPNGTAFKVGPKIESNENKKRISEDDINRNVKKEKRKVPDVKLNDKSILNIDSDNNVYSNFKHVTKSDNVQTSLCDKSIKSSDSRDILEETKKESCAKAGDLDKTNSLIAQINVDDSNVYSSKVSCDQNVFESSIYKSSDELISNVKEEKIEGLAIKQIEAITEDLSNLIQEMKDLSIKTAQFTKKVDVDITQTDLIDLSNKVNVNNEVPVNHKLDNVVLKKNKSESSLDSPDLEVSRLMNKKLVSSPFCDSSSSLEISGSSMESLNAIDSSNIPQMSKSIPIQESIESDIELDRRKFDRFVLSTDSSIESNTSEIVSAKSTQFLNTSLSSTDSVSPIMFGKGKKIHGSFSSLEASVSSVDSAVAEKIMAASADSGIEHSSWNPIQCKSLSNDGTLTKIPDVVKGDLQETLTASPKRTNSLLDVPTLKTKTTERTRKTSCVAPYVSPQLIKAEEDKLVETKLPTNLEKLLSLFQHPASLFSRSTSQNDDDKKSNTPPRKDSYLASSFWSWGNLTEKGDKEVKGDDRDSPSENTDSTLSERSKVSYVDESASRKLEKTPSTDTENTLSEFQSLTAQMASDTSDSLSSEIENKIDRVTTLTTNDDLVQNNLDLSLQLVSNTSFTVKQDESRSCDKVDLINPNESFMCSSAIATVVSRTEHMLNKEDENCCKSLSSLPVAEISDPPSTKVVSENLALVLEEAKPGKSRDLSILELAHAIDESLEENDCGKNESDSVYNVSESEMPVWEVKFETLDENVNTENITMISNIAPIATIDEVNDENLTDLINLDKVEEKDLTFDRGIISLRCDKSIKQDKMPYTSRAVFESDIDPANDALYYLPCGNRYLTDVPKAKSPDTAYLSVCDREQIDVFNDLSPELIIDEGIEPSEVLTKEIIGVKTSQLIPDRAKLKKSNSMEELSQRLKSIELESPKTSKAIAFKIPEGSATTPRDIPQRRKKFRPRSGSSPKSLPESLNRSCPLTKMDSLLGKKKKKVSSLGKIAKDSLLALNLSEEEIAEFRRSYKLTSVESLKSLGSVSEDANSQSGTSVDSRCRSCLRTSQESLMSLDSINEDCTCSGDCVDAGTHSAR